MPRTRRLALATLLASALFPAVAAAQHAIVGADEVKAFVEARRAGKAKGVLVDVRTPEEYAQAHVPGAINIPAERVKAEAARLPKDRSAPLWFYCRGAG